MLGSFELQKLNQTCSKTMLRPTGFQKLSNKVDLTSGYRMPKIGVSVGIDSGVTLSPFGFPMTCRRLYVLDRLLNWRSWLVSRMSLIYTERILTIWRSLPKKGKAISKELKRFLIVGSRVVRCLMHKFIILSHVHKKSSRLYSLLISLEKVLIRPEDGFIHWL